MSQIVSHYCKGKGVEIGRGSQNNYKLDCPNIDIQSHKIWEDEQMDYGVLPARVDHISKGWDMPIESESLDYVFSSHQIEHQPQVIRQIVETHRVLVNGGKMVFVIPYPNALKSDSTKALTTLKRVLQRHKNNYNVSDSTDYHISRWRPSDFDKIVTFCKRAKLCSFDLLDVLSPDDQAGNGFVLVYERC